MHDSLKSGEIARTAPPDAHDAQLSNGPIGASIRVREVPIQQCQRLTSHSTQYRKTENDRRGKRRKTNGGYKGGKQGTRTNKAEQSGESTSNGPLVRRSQDKEAQRMVSTINETMVRQTQEKNGKNDKKVKNDKRSSIEVQEKQTGQIPKEPD